MFPKLVLFWAVCTALVPVRVADGEEMAMKTLDESEFLVAGYSVRTNNADEAAGRGRIGDLWRRFREENLAAKIPNREDGDLIVVYSDYASDEKGDYDYLLGARVSSIQGLPAGMTYQKIAAGRYVVFTTRQGSVAEVVADEWKRIWRAAAAELGGRRRFLTDYEIYDRRSADPRHAQVEIHIGIDAGQL